MTGAAVMQVTLRLPAQTLFDGDARKLFAVAENGAFGMLPRHIDFVTVLVPSVLILTSPEGDERFFGIDEGLLVKKGYQVEVVVRRGVEGEDLATLGETVTRTFVEVDEKERVARTALSRLEANMVRQFVDLGKPVL